MSNQSRAAQCIKASYETGFNTPRDIAEYLDESGLLAPDLPGPAQSFGDGTKGWFVEDDEGRDIGSIYIFDGEILLRTAAGRVKGSPAQMRKIALALLAATNHAEENQ